MRRMAKAFLKVQDNLAALREYEKQENRKSSASENRVVGAAKRAAAAYKR